MNRFFFFTLLGVMSSASSFAESNSRLKEKLETVFANKTIRIFGYDDHLKRVDVDSEYVYVSHDGRYVFAGPIYDTLRKVDIVAERERQVRKDLLNSKSKDLFIRYPSTEKERFSVTVFTAINCPYCRKLHQAVPVLNEQGISVNYVMLPRGAVSSVSYDKTQSALCSDDPASAITKAMQNHDLSYIACDSNQLSQHIELARVLNVNSTPTFVLPNGDLQVGYVSPDRLLQTLENLNSKKVSNEPL